MIRPEWIIFDIGGVLFDYEKSLEDILSHLKIEKQTFYKQVDKSMLDTMEGQATIDDVWNKILKELNSEHEIEKVLEIWWDSKYWIEDTRKLAEDLDGAGYLVALFTNNWVGMTKSFSEYGPSVSKHLFESAVEKLSKPNPKFYKIVEKRIEALGDKIYFIDDKIKNIETAKKLGWQTFHYSFGGDSGKSSNEKIRSKLL